MGETWKESRIGGAGAGEGGRVAAAHAHFFFITLKPRVQKYKSL